MDVVHRAMGATCKCASAVERSQFQATLCVAATVAWENSGGGEGRWKAFRTAMLPLKEQLGGFEVFCSVGKRNRARLLQNPEALVAPTLGRDGNMGAAVRIEEVIRLLLGYNWMFSARNSEQPAMMEHREQKGLQFRTKAAQTATLPAGTIDVPPETEAVVLQSLATALEKELGADAHALNPDCANVRSWSVGDQNMAAALVYLRCFTPYPYTEKGRRNLRVVSSRVPYLGHVEIYIHLLKPEWKATLLLATRSLEISGWVVQRSYIVRVVANIDGFAFSS